jgi:hypothetical protein
VQRYCCNGIAGNYHHFLRCCCHCCHLILFSKVRGMPFGLSFCRKLQAWPVHK